MLRTAVLLVIAVACGGCGTLFNGTTEDLKIDSYPRGAKVTFLNADYLGEFSTPSKIELKRNRSYTAVLELAGYETRTVRIQHGMSGWVWGNIVLGGLIGVAIDAISGGWANLEPDRVFVNLETGGIGENASEVGAPEFED